MVAQSANQAVLGWIYVLMQVLMTKKEKNNLMPNVPRFINLQSVQTKHFNHHHDCSVLQVKH